MTEQARELVPCGRFEWERVIKRIVWPKPVKFLALTLATYADPDGSRVRPGMDALAGDTGDTARNVGRLMGVLLDVGMVEEVARGGGRNGRGRASAYRLTVPTDLLGRVTLRPLGTADDVSPDTQMSGHSNESADTQMSGDSDRTPVDNLDSPDTRTSPENDFHLTNNGVPEPLTGHFEPIDRTPGCPTTNHNQPLKTKHSGFDPAQLTTARGQLVDENPDPPPVEEIARRFTKCDHGLVHRTGPNGKPDCPLCRRGLPSTPDTQETLDA